MVYFSGTDKQCLHDNAPAHDMFLSVIVNQQGHRVAKLCLIAEVEQSLSYKIAKKLFSLKTEPEKYLAIFDCKVVIGGDAAIIKEFKTIDEECKRKRKKVGKNYSQMPVNPNSGRRMLLTDGAKANGQQAHLFPVEEFDNTLADEPSDEELMADKYIDNLLARSFSVDDLEVRELVEVIPATREDLPDGDQNDFIDLMVQHYEYSLRAEYYPDNFERVINKSINQLDRFHNFRFINVFIHELRNLIKHYNDPDPDLVGDTTIADMGQRGGGAGAVHTKETF